MRVEAEDMDRDINLELVNQNGGRIWHGEFLLLGHLDGAYVLLGQKTVHLVEITLEIRNK
jgi:hypothetical protein